ncbi:MAG: ABC transporter permease [Nitrososphaerales archaeon]
MLRYIIRRLLLVIPVFIGVSLIAFLIMKLTPGDPILNVLGMQPTGDPSFIAAMRAELGLDDPIYIQYGKFLWRVLQGDLGRSIGSNKPVIILVSEALPRTLLLVVSSMIVAIAIGIPVGVVSSVRQHSALDHATRVGSIFAASLPDFWLGLMLMMVFSYYLGLTPISGYGKPEHIILPATTLGIGLAGLITRLTRSSMLEVIRQDYIRAAKAKGMSERGVIFKHALRNALIPIVTVLGLQFGFLLAGAFFVEWVFAWPGIGRLAVQAIQQRDYPVVLGALLVTSIAYVVINIIVDIIYAYIDPRVQYE